MKENEAPIKLAMDAPIKYTMLIVLFTALVLVVAVQAFFMMKLARPTEPAAASSQTAAGSVWMDQMFNDAFGRFLQSPYFDSMWGGTSFSPSMDVEEKKGNYIIRMDIPGADKADISISIDDRELVVSGKIDETIEEQGKNQLRKERRSGEFKRELSLPEPVKADEMEAKYEKGVLTITLPQGEELQGRARSIQIK